jgi:hypothetical protein
MLIHASSPLRRRRFSSIYAAAITPLFIDIFSMPFSLFAIIDTPLRFF